MQKYFLGVNFICLRKKGDFSDVFLLFMASVRSRLPGPPAGPGAFLMFVTLAAEKLAINLD